MNAPTVRPPARSTKPAVPSPPSPLSRAPASPAAGAPDPRIVARRIAVKRDEGRRRLRRLAWAASVAAVLAGAALLTRTPVLDVDHVRVDGAARVPAAHIAAAAADAGAARGDPLLDVRADGVARAVETLPGVADATVRRRWPGTIEIAVIERRPVATVVVGATFAEIAADGVVIDVWTSPPAGLPLLDGVSVDAEPGAVVDAADLLAVAAALPRDIAARVASVATGDAPRSVELRLADGARVVLGPVAELGAKLTAVLTVLEQVDLGCVAVLDVRVPSAPAVTPRPGCQT